MTAVLKGALADFLFIYAPGSISPKKKPVSDVSPETGHRRTRHSRVPGEVFASGSVRQNNGINHVYDAIAGIDVGYYYL